MICVIERYSENGEKLDVIDMWGRYIPTEHEIDYGSDLHKYQINWYSPSQNTEGFEEVIAEREELAVADFWSAAEDVPEDAVIESVEDWGVVA